MWNVKNAEVVLALFVDRRYFAKFADRIYVNSLKAETADDLLHISCAHTYYYFILRGDERLMILKFFKLAPADTAVHHEEVL